MGANPPSASLRTSRRSFLTGSAATAVYWSSCRHLGAAEAERLRFGLTPVMLTNDLDLLNALVAYLAEATGYAVELISRRTYQEITSLLVSGQLDAAWICGYPYVQYRRQLELVAIPLWNGRPVYQSYLITAADRDAREIGDLEGDIHAFSDPDSNSGYLVTRALMRERKLDPAVFFRKTIFTYGHRNVIRAVASRLAQSGSVDGYVWEVVRELEPDLVAATRPMRKSEWLGFPPIATSKALAGTPKLAALGRALRSMPLDDGGRRVLDMLRLSGFGDPDDSVFDAIAAKMDLIRSTS
jgi:phosphate/phosphite/phosphonate ABC transporter binding protein